MNVLSAGKVIEMLGSTKKRSTARKRTGFWYKPWEMAEHNGVPGIAMKSGKTFTFCTPTKVVDLKGMPAFRRTKAKLLPMLFKIMGGFAEGAIGKDGKAGASARRVIGHAVNELALKMQCNVDPKHRSMAHLLNVCAWAIGASDYLEGVDAGGSRGLAEEMRLRYAEERHERRIGLALAIIEASSEQLPDLAAALRLAITTLPDRQLLRDAVKLLLVEAQPTEKDDDVEHPTDPALPEHLFDEVLCNETILIIPGPDEYTLITPQGMGLTLSRHDGGYIYSQSSALVALVPYQSLTVDEHLRQVAEFIACQSMANHKLLAKLINPDASGVTPEFRSQIACLLVLAGREHTRTNGSYESLCGDISKALRKEVYKSQVWRVEKFIEWQQVRDGVRSMQFVMDELSTESAVDLIFAGLASVSIGSAVAMEAMEAFKRLGIEDEPALPAKPVLANPAAVFCAPGSPHYDPFTTLVNVMFADVANKNHAAVHDFLCKMLDFQMSAAVEDGCEAFEDGTSNTRYCAKLNGELHLASVVPLLYKPGAALNQVFLMRKADGNYRMIYSERHIGAIPHRDDAAYTSCSVLFSGLIKKRLITACGLPLDRVIDVSSQAKLDWLKALIEDPDRTAPILVSGVRETAKAFVEQGSEGILVAVIDGKLDARQIGLSWVKAEGKGVLYPVGYTEPSYTESYSHLMWLRIKAVELIEARLNEIESVSSKIQQHRLAQAAAAAEQVAALRAELEQAKATSDKADASTEDGLPVTCQVEVERLADEKRAAELEVQRLRAEVDQLKRELREEQRRREGVLATFAGSDVGEESLQTFNTETFDELPEWSRTIAGRVTVTSRAIKEAQGITGYMNCPLVYRVLQAMHDHLWPSKFAGDTEGMGRWLEFLKNEGLDFAKCGEVARSHSLGSSYQVMHAGERLELDMHIRGHSGRDIRRQLRVYYTWHDKSRQLVIGSMPTHLPIASS